jgi:molybdopterin synthase catalytic subunit
MEIEHYPGMCERAITAMAREARARWGLGSVKIIHRFGRLEVGAPIMMVAVVARHRVAAFEAAEFLMDWLKSRAPFWKREITATGADWVAQKALDEAALRRWQG